MENLSATDCQMLKITRAEIDSALQSVGGVEGVTDVLTAMKDTAKVVMVMRGIDVSDDSADGFFTKLLGAINAAIVSKRAARFTGEWEGGSFVLEIE